MGCDIHLYSETKKEGKWQTDNPLEIDTDYPNEPPYIKQLSASGRNYCLFGLLAKIRREYSWSLEPKDFPDDASKEITDIFTDWGVDAHTPSYLSLQEITDLLAELETRPMVELILSNPDVSEAVSIQKEYLQEILTELPTEPEHLEDRRIVFWFDN